MVKNLIENFKSSWQVPTYSQLVFRKKRFSNCICIPVINEGELFQKQLRKMKKIADLADIIILDGGSTDGSTSKDFLKNCGVRTLLVKKGQGKLSAQLRMGYSYALNEGYKGIVTIDGNGKDDASAIPQFLKKLNAGFDFIQGSRFLPGGKAVNTPLDRYLAIRMIHVPVSNLFSGFHYTDTTNGYRGYSTKFLLHQKVQPFRHIFSGYELLAYLSIRAPQLSMAVTEMPVMRSYPLGKTPTKINIPSYVGLLVILFKVGLGWYNPKI